MTPSTLNNISHPEKAASLYDLFRSIAEIEKELWVRYKIKDQGSYAEHLVAEALGARRLDNGVNKGFDLLHDLYGKIEVRSRRYTLDDRLEDRAKIPHIKTGLYDYFVHVVFKPCFKVHGAYITSHDGINVLAEKSKHRYVRFSEGQALPESIDITEKLQALQSL